MTTRGKRTRRPTPSFADAIAQAEIDQLPNGRRHDISPPTWRSSNCIRIDAGLSSRAIHRRKMRRIHLLHDPSQRMYLWIRSLDAKAVRRSARDDEESSSDVATFGRGTTPRGCLPERPVSVAPARSGVSPCPIPPIPAPAAGGRPRRHPRHRTPARITPGRVPGLRPVPQAPPPRRGDARGRQRSMPLRAPAASLAGTPAHPRWPTRSDRSAKLLPKDQPRGLDRYDLGISDCSFIANRSRSSADLSWPGLHHRARASATSDKRNS